MVSEQRSCDELRTEFRQLWAAAQSMMAEMERENARCISEMQRVYDTYTRRSKPRRFEIPEESSTSLLLHQSSGLSNSKVSYVPKNKSVTSLEDKEEVSEVKPTEVFEVPTGHATDPFVQGSGEKEVAQEVFAEMSGRDPQFVKGKMINESDNSDEVVYAVDAGMFEDIRPKVRRGASGVTGKGNPYHIWLFLELIRERGHAYDDPGGFPDCLLDGVSFSQPSGITWLNEMDCKEDVSVKVEIKYDAENRDHSLVSKNKEEICCCLKTQVELSRPNIMIFNLVLAACMRFGASLKGQQIMGLMAVVGVAAKVHTVVIVARIHEMNAAREELKEFKDCVDTVPASLAHPYVQFYDSLLSLQFKFNDIDGISLYSIVSNDRQEAAILGPLITDHAKGGKCIEFTQTKRDAHKLANALQSSFKCELLQGDISQNQRERNYLMQVICDAALAEEVEIRKAAFECLVSIVSTCYEVLEP